MCKNLWKICNYPQENVNTLTRAGLHEVLGEEVHAAEEEGLANAETEHGANKASCVAGPARAYKQKKQDIAEKHKQYGRKEHVIGVWACFEA